MKEIEKLKETILKEYPRLNEDDKFKFHCHKGLSCFNDCCGDINIFLTPYDIIRLKNALGISSEEFISKYTIAPFDENLKYPVLLLKMQENERKSCYFVSEKGCKVYEDRPWACRMYPLGQASPSDEHKEINQPFYFMMKENLCKGWDEENEQSVNEWLSDQGITDYEKMGEYFKKLTLHRFFQEGGNLPPEKVEMFFTVCYNIDKFKKFVFETSFLDKFEVAPEVVAKIKDDDTELLKFGYDWLRFALFGEDTLHMKADVVAAKTKELEEKQKKDMQNKQN